MRDPGAPEKTRRSCLLRAEPLQRWSLAALAPGRGEGLRLTRRRRGIDAAGLAHGTMRFPRSPPEVPATHTSTPKPSSSPCRYWYDCYRPMSGWRVGHQDLQFPRFSPKISCRKNSKFPGARQGPAIARSSRPRAGHVSERARGEREVSGGLRAWRVCLGVRSFRRGRVRTSSRSRKGNKLTRPLQQRDGDRGVEPEG